MFERNNTLGPESVQPAGSWEKAYIVFALTFFSTAIIPLLRAKETGVGSADSGRDILGFVVQAVVFLGLTVLVRGNFRKLVQLSFKDKLLWVMLAIVLVSVAWSDVPFQTFRRSIVLVATTLFGVYLAYRFSLLEQLRLLSITLFLTLSSSLVVGLFLPDWGRMTEEWDFGWRGVFAQKNSLARIAVLAILVFATEASMRSEARNRARIGLVLAAVLLLLSASKTGLLIGVSFAVIVPLLRIVRRSSKRKVVAVVVLVLFAAIAVAQAVDFDSVLRDMGKDATLTGRTPLWGACILMLMQRPVLGYGYNGFWLDDGGPSAYVWAVVRWNAPSAHNGFLDIALDFGLVGLAAFMCYLLVNAKVVLSSLRSSVGPLALWPAVFLCYLVIYNLDESVLFGHNNLWWVLLVSITLSIRRQLSMESKPCES